MRVSIAHLSNNKKLLAGLGGVAVLAVVGTTVGYHTLTSDVTLTLDGTSRQVTTMGGTVGDVLSEEGIELSARDFVAPAVDTKIGDGTKIAVKYARPVALTVDGNTSTHWVTAASVSDALTEIGASYQRADLSVSRSSSIGRDGIDLDVVTAKKLTLKVGAKKNRSVEVAASTVGDVLDQLGVKVDSDDVVKPAADSALRDGAKIVVERIRVATRTVTGETIPFRTQKQDDDSLTKGETSTVREGRSGTRDATYRVTFRNGKEVARSVVSTKVRSKPVAAVVKVGTAADPAPNYAGGDTVWDALARCESGGNWATNTGNGYYGGLQFSAGTWRSVGGSGLPHQASREEQIRRGKILQARSGWGQWPGCSSRLGLR